MTPPSLRRFPALVGKGLTATAATLLPQRMTAEIRRFRDVHSGARAVYLRRLIGRMLQPTRGSPPIDPERCRSVLFLCHGNIMRSALAESLLRQRLEGSKEADTVIRSAGLHARGGHPADHRMRHAAQAFGASLETHVATAVSAQLVADADVIFVMDYTNEAELFARLPAARSKTRLLGALSPSARDGLAIPDPYVGDVTSAEQCAARILRCIDVLAAQLGSDAETKSTSRA
jgi:protein-tyrosine phosphatase